MTVPRLILLLVVLTLLPATAMAQGGIPRTQPVVAMSDSDTTATTAPITTPTATNHSFGGRIRNSIGNGIHSLKRLRLGRPEAAIDVVDVAAGAVRHRPDKGRVLPLRMEQFLDALRERAEVVR